MWRIMQLLLQMATCLAKLIVVLILFSFFTFILYPRFSITPLCWGPHVGTSILSPLVNMVLPHCSSVHSHMRGYLCLQSRVYDVYAFVHLPKGTHVIGLISSGYISLLLRALDVATVFRDSFFHQGFVIFRHISQNRIVADICLPLCKKSQA